MRYRTLLVAACIFSSSCDPCARLDCAVSRDSGQFRIVRASDGSDLLFGTQKMYPAGAIQFYTLQNSDTTFYQSRAEYNPGAGYDSVLQVRFFPQADTAYMRLPNNDVDTLRLTFETLDSRCCGTLTNITSLRLNNAIDLPVRGPQEIRK